MRTVALFAAALTLCSALPAWAGEVAGTVFDARGLPVAGMTVDLAGQQAVSGSDGAFVFADVAAGQHQVIAGSQAVAVVVPAEGTVRRNLFLLSAAARSRVTGVEAAAADGATLLAETRALADRLLAEGDTRPARQIADVTG